MKIIETTLPGLLLIEPIVFQDERGHFYEVFQQQRYQQYNFAHFVQDNVSRSKKNVLRGLHYQNPCTQGKLVGVTQGSVWDVAVDLRLNSKTFGKWYGTILSDQNHLQMYIPYGMAHGFCVLSEQADFYYKCTALYCPSTEHGIAWNDPILDISWPIQNPILSDKDKQYARLDEIDHALLFA